MGLYEYVLGNIFIPVMLLMLALLSLGKGRRQLHGLIISGINITITIGSFNVPVFPMLTIVNGINFLVMMEKITSLRSAHGKEEDHFHLIHTGEYMEDLLLCYRNLMLNLCSCLLIIQVYVAGVVYSGYKPVKDEADKLKKELYSK